MHKPVAYFWIGGVALAVACGGATTPAGGGGGGGLTLSRIPIGGDAGSSLGVLDPSLLYPAGAASGFMAYTSVPTQATVHTRVAQSNDGGATWTFLTDVNVATLRTLTTTDTSVCGTTSCSGTWVHEVPSMVLDSTDPNANRRYKVFVHSYFITDAGKLEYTFGRISLYTAAAPAGPWSAEGPLLGWNSTSPVSSDSAVQNISTDPGLTGLNTCLLLTEPGAQVRGTTIDLAVGCVWFSGTKFPIDIRLVRSTNHGASWTFVTTLLDTTDANALGSDRAQINGADLFTIGGQYYLFADPHTGSSAYAGCVELQFTNVATGALLRTLGGPEPRRQYNAPTGVSWAPCTAAAGATQSGILMGIASLSVSPPFGIYATKQVPP